MRIAEAAQQAIERDGFMTREHTLKDAGAKIKPTNLPECCICYKNGKPSARRWNPKAEDLIADDWIVVD